MKYKAEDKCCKCKSSLEGGGSIHSWGKVYDFCRLCFIIVNQDDQPGSCERFMSGHGMSLMVSSMIKARRRRASGKSPWVNPS